MKGRDPSWTVHSDKGRGMTSVQLAGNLPFALNKINCRTLYLSLLQI